MYIDDELCEREFLLLILIVRCSFFAQCVTHMYANQVEMVAEYMPREHRQLVSDLTARICASGTTMRAFATGDVDHTHARSDVAHPPLASAYDAALAALRSFRMFHLGVATRYLQRTRTGTGNSSFRNMLKQAVESIDHAKVTP